jgi:hypothetical protein
VRLQRGEHRSAYHGAISGQNAAKYGKLVEMKRSKGMSRPALEMSAHAAIGLREPRPRAHGAFFCRAVNRSLPHLTPLQHHTSTARGGHAAAAAMSACERGQPDLSAHDGKTNAH